MTCSCQIDVDLDGDMVVVLSDKMVKARKDHKCRECSDLILKGQIYRKEKYVFDGKITTHKTCLDCNSVRESLFCNFYYGMIWETFIDTIADSDGQLSESCISKLTPVAREKVCELIEEQWEEDEDL